MQTRHQVKTRRCAKCGVEKPLTEYRVCAKSRDGHRKVCKECQKIQKRNWYRRKAARGDLYEPKTDGTKQCSQCRTVKPITEFHVNSYAKDGRASQCKQCQYEGQKAAWIGPEGRRKFFRVTASKTAYRSKNQSMCECTLTAEDLESMWGEQDGKCALTGMPLITGSYSRRSDEWFDGVSLDRIDPDGGYTRRNVRLVSNWVNTARNRLSDEGFRRRVVAAYKTLKGEIDGD